MLDFVDAIERALVNFSEWLVWLLKHTFICLGCISIALSALYPLLRVDFIPQYDPSVSIYALLVGLGLVAVGFIVEQLGYYTISKIFSIVYEL